MWEALWWLIAHQPEVCTTVDGMLPDPAGRTHGDLCFHLPPIPVLAGVFGFGDDWDPSALKWTRREGLGVCVIDPHGDLITRVLAAVPPPRVDEVVLSDPSDTTRPVGFNMLACTTEDERYAVAENFIGLLYQLRRPGARSMSLLCSPSAVTAAWRPADAMRAPSGVSWCRSPSGDRRRCIWCGADSRRHRLPHRGKHSAERTACRAHPGAPAPQSGGRGT